MKILTHSYEGFEFTKTFFFIPTEKGIGLEKEHLENSQTSHQCPILLKLVHTVLFKKPMFL